jgi:hypothetical protein
MEPLLFAAAALTQSDTVNEASYAGIYVSAGVTATIFGANNAMNSMIGVHGSNHAIMVGANDGAWLDGGSADSLTLATGVGAFVSAGDVGVTLSHFNPHPAAIVDVLYGSGGHVSASAFGPLGSDVAEGLQLGLGGGHAIDVAGSVWNFG